MNFWNVLLKYCRSGRVCMGYVVIVREIGGYILFYK